MAQNSGKTAGRKAGKETGRGGAAGGADTFSIPETSPGGMILHRSGQRRKAPSLAWRGKARLFLPWPAEHLSEASRDGFMRIEGRYKRGE